MIIRVYEPCTKFGTETVEYHDFACNKYQVYQGILHLMRFGANDLFIPLASMKLFEEIATNEVTSV